MVIATDEAVADSGEDYTYTVTDGNATITGYLGPGGDITMPSTLGGCPVTAIGASSFQDNTNITSIIIPDSITTIGDNGFQGCVALTSVTIGKGVTSIGINAFAYSSSLISISFHELTSPSVSSDWILGTHASIEGHALRSSDFPAPGGSFNGLLMGSYIASDYLYVIGSGQVTITGYVGAGGDIVLPSNIGGYPVTVINNYAFREISTITSVIIPDSVRTIGDRAFLACSSLTSVDIPGSVTLMGTYAFANCLSLISVTIGDGVATINEGDFEFCTSLTSIVIPNSVTSIGRYAFHACSALTSVSLGSGVTSIGSNAFYACSSLTAIDVDADNSIYASLDGVLYDKNFTTLVLYPGGSSGPFTVPDGVTNIGDYAFASGLITSVTIPGSVTSIGNYSFRYCYALTSMTIDYGVTYIGYYSFYHCTALTSINLPESVTIISSNAFAYSGLTSIYIPGSATIGHTSFGYSNLTSVTIGFGVSSIGVYAFQSCSALASVSIPESVTIIGYYAFYKCTALTSVHIPDSVTIIDDSAFSGSGLTSVTIGNGVTVISEETFRDCSSLVSVTLGNSVTTISRYAFMNCGSLTSITIPESVTTIGDRAFYVCRALNSITIPAGVTAIGALAFAACDSLSSFSVDADNPNYASVNGLLCSKDGTILIQYPGGMPEPVIFPASVTTIGYAAFSYSKITSITIPDTVTTMGDYAFDGCSLLSSVVIGNGITAISSRAFHFCSALSSVTIPDSVTVIGGYAFYWCRSLTSITIPESVTRIDAYAFAQSPALTSIIIPDSVTMIGNNAFWVCQSLTSVTIGRGVTSIGAEAFYYCTSLDSINFHGLAKPTAVGASWIGYTPSTIRGHAYYSSNFPAPGVRFLGLMMGDYIPEYTFTVTDGSATITGYIGPGGAAKIPATLGSYPVTTIGDYAFQYNANITSITIPNSVTTIGAEAFFSCSALTSITLGDGVTSIGEYAFARSALTSITIPGSVTSIENHAFAWSDLTSITFLNSATSIGSEAFYYCTGLTSVTLGSGVISIGDSAFTGCYALISVTIPASVSTIGDYAFTECSALTAIEVDPGNPNYASLGGVLYSKDMTVLIQYPAGISGAFVIPNSVTTIGKSAFTWCFGLTSVSIPNSVTSIENSAFYFCSALTSITIPNSVTSIEDATFGVCTSLNSVTIPNSVTSIGDWAFRLCYSLNSITIPNSVISIGTSAFERCTTLTSIMIPYGVTSISNSTFDHCSNLVSVTVPNSVTSIGSYAFYYCTSLTSITIPNSVTSIGSYAFSRTGLTSGTIPEGVTAIGDYAYSFCTYLNSMTISSSVTSIGEGAFGRCDQLQSITFLGLTAPTNVGSNWIVLTPSTIRGHAYYSSNFPAKGESFYGLIMGDHIPEFTYTVTDGKATITGYIGPGGAAKIPSTLGGCPVIAIGDNSFKNNGNITSLTIPNSVQTIGDYAFYACSALTSVTLPDSVTSIGNDTFWHSALTSIIIPDNVTFIGSSAFADCRDLVSVIMGSGVTHIRWYTFSLCPSLSSVSIGSGVTSIGYRAFEYCKSLYSITFPNGLTSIDKAAFASSGLISVTFPETVTSIGAYAFESCTSLTSAVIPNSVTKIDNNTFFRCYSLSSISIGSGVTSIGNYAFYFCESLTSISIPDNISTIGNNAFGLCKKLTSVTIPDSVTSIGNNAFYSCIDLTSVTFGSGITSIGATAFNMCTNLISITFHGLIAPTTVGADWITGTNVNIRGHAYYSSNFPAKGESFYGLIMGDHIPEFTYTVTDGKATITGYIGPGGAVKIPPSLSGFPVVAIGTGSFQYNANITSLTIHDDNITSIGDFAFFGCSALTSVTMGNGVTSIGNYAFADCSVISSLTIGGGVASIGTEAFRYCTGLTSVTIPDGVTTIGFAAFSGCSSLTSITIGSGVTFIDTGVFYGCYALTAIDVDPDNLNYASVDGVLYSEDLTTLIQYPAGLTGPFVIPNGVVTIGYDAFRSCKGLTSITLPNSVTTIGNSAFSECSSLSSINIGSGVTTIYDSAFASCPITSMSLPDSVTTIGWDVFAYCYGLTAVTFGSGLTTIGGEVFGECYSLSSVTFLGLTAPTYVDDYWLWHVPSTVRGHAYYSSNFPAMGSSFHGLIMGDYIPEYTYTVTDGNATITGYIGPGGAAKIPFTLGGFPVVAIGDNAFQYNANITSIIIPDSVTSIGASAFESCTSLTSVSIPASVTNIGEKAFAFCTYLTAVTIPEGVTSIQDGVFYRCYRLSSLNIPESVTSIGNASFSSCYWLTSVIIPEGVTSLGNDAFYDCSALTSVSLPDSLISIGDGAFTWCPITSVTIPEGLTYLGSHAFAGCTLTSITIPGTVTTIGSGAFASCGFLTSVNISEGVVIIGDSSFYNCLSLATITIPSTVTNIGKSAFKSSSSLTSITFLSIESPSVGSDWIINTNESLVGHAYYGSNFPAPGGNFSGLIMGAYIPEDYTYTVTDGNATITSYLGVGGNITIPMTLGGCPVVAIGDQAFYSNSNITSVIIPETVTRIGEWAFLEASIASLTIQGNITSMGDFAFANCPLTSLNISEGITVIGNEAFYGCVLLPFVNIPASVESIGYQAFHHCYSLTAIEVAAENAYYASVDGVLFDKTISTLIRCPGGKSGTFTVPDGVTLIGEYAFDHCRHITGVIFPNSVEAIGDSAFNSCSDLVSISMPNGVTSIGNHTFEFCSHLSSVTIPSSVTYMGDYAFQSCPVLTSISIPGSIIAIGNHSFSNCLSLTSVTISEGITSIGIGAFSQCSSLTSLTIPSTVMSIDGGAFAYCTSLTNMTFHGLTSPTVGINWIGGADSGLRGHAYYASNFPAPGSDFNGLLMGAYIPEDYTYTVADGKATVTGYMGPGGDIAIPSTLGGCPVVAIGYEAFSYCFHLTSVTIPSTVTTIGEKAFFCLDKSFTSINFLGLEKPTYVGKWAFQTGGFAQGHAYYASNFPPPGTGFEYLRMGAYLPNYTFTVTDNEVTITGYIGPGGIIEIPSNMCGFPVVAIGSSAFESNAEIISVTIPSTVTTLGTHAFAYCASLADITFLGLNSPTVGSGWIEGTNSGLRGHAYYASNFPAPGGDFNGLIMGAYIYEGYTYTVTDGNATITGYLGTGGNITIPETLGGCPVVAIGDSAFESCTSLINVTIPSTVTTIGAQAFLQCDHLESVNISEGVTTIGQSAFYACTSLTNVTFPDTLITINEGAFAFCTSLTNVTIPSGVSTIGRLAFGYCDAMIAFDVHPENEHYASVDGVLYDHEITTLIQYPSARAETSFIIPGTVTTIEESAFCPCHYLESLTIPSGLTTIGTEAFCSYSLTSIIFLGLERPTSIADGWIAAASSSLHGHAYPTSNFPSPGNYFPEGDENGLLMDSYLADVTFSQTGVDTSNTGIVLTVDGTTYLASQLPVTFTWYSNSIHTFAWSDVVSIDSGTRYGWQSTSGLSTNMTGTITIPDAGGAVSALYATQHKVSFIAIGLDSDAGTSAVLTVGTTEYAWDALPSDMWINDGTPFSWEGTVPAIGDRVFTLTGHTGLASPIEASGIETANYFKSLTISGHVYLSGTTTGAAGWHMQLWKEGSQVGPDVVTDATGVYSFTVTLPGTYQIREVLKDGWTETAPILTYSAGDGSTPSVLGYDGITVTSGVDVIGKDFENFEWLTVSGLKFFDANGNGFKNPGEPGLQYWEISIERNGSVYLGSVLTDINGFYEFTVKDPDVYTMSESVKGWWIQTCPVEESYTFTARSGEDVTDLDFGNWLGNQALVTTSDLCMFDLDEDTSSGRQFRLIFTPDVPDYPSQYRLTASNPGQFYFNVFFLGCVEEGDVFTMNIPFPFVTQGAEPVHAYSSLNSDPYGWLVPGIDISGMFDISPSSISWMFDGSDVFGETAQITLTANEGYCGFLYINVHLDYGLKNNIGALSINYDNDAYGAALTIEEGCQYLFSAQGHGSFSADDGVMNTNVFKRNPGFGGLVLDAEGDPVVNATVEIWFKNDLIGTVVTDDDGWYMLEYKHLGKPTTYTLKVKLPGTTEGYDYIQDVTVKANSFSMVIFCPDMPTDDPGDNTNPNKPPKKK